MALWDCCRPLLRRKKEMDWHDLPWGFLGGIPAALARTTAGCYAWILFRKDRINLVSGFSEGRQFVPI